MITQNQGPTMPYNGYPIGIPNKEYKSRRSLGVPINEVLLYISVSTFSLTASYVLKGFHCPFLVKLNKYIKLMQPKANLEINTAIKKTYIHSVNNNNNNTLLSLPPPPLQLYR